MTDSRKSRVKLTQARGDAFVRPVLRASLERLAEVGFDRFSIPEVAALAGANKTSVYRRWPTKEALIGDALRAAMDQADEARSSGSLRKDLIELARKLGEFLTSNAGRSVMRILLSAADNTDLRAIATSAYGDTSRRAAWIAMDEAVKRGELKEEIDPSTVLFTMAGALIHRVWVEKAGLNEAFFEAVVDLVLNGAAARRSQPDN